MPIGRRRVALLMAFACLFTPWASAQSGQQLRRVAHVVFAMYKPPNPNTQALSERLAERGFAQGRNVEVRNFSIQEGVGNAISPEANRLVIEVLEWRPDVIVVGGDPGNVRVFQKATSTIPIVFGNVQDPVAAGLVASLARPGGNVTGVGTHYDDLVVKRLQLTRELLPSARALAVLIDRRAGGIPAASRELLEAAARRLKLRVIAIDIAQVDGGLCSAAKRIMHSRVSAIMVWGNISEPATYPSPQSWYADCLVQLQQETRLPVVDDTVHTVRAGVVLGLGEDPVDAYRRAGELVARILDGANPATLPVDMATRPEFYLNARSARELGLKVPQSLLVRADRVIN